METAGPAALWDVFRQGGEAFARHPAVRTVQGELSFAELFAAAARVAEALRRAGLADGSYVVFAAPNSAAFVAVVLGLWKMSSSVGLVNPLDGASELLALAGKVPPAAYVVADRLAEAWATVLGARAVALDAEVAGERFALLTTEATGPANPHPDAAVIKFTSGSTGEPKGVALTAANVLAEAASVAHTLGLTPDDTILSPVPLCHSYGFDLGGLAMLQSGASLMLQDAFIGRRAIADLADGRVSVFLGVPAMFRLMMDAPERHRRDLGAARWLLSCTAPLSPTLIAAFHARFGAVICQHYGSSEAGAVTTHVPARVLDLPESVGRPMDGVTVTIVDPDGQELAPGTEGEVVVRSPAVAARYVMGASEDRPLRDGTVRMGDAGRLDGDGFLTLTGRLDQTINVGGFKVSPLEVVQVLERYGPVREAAVTGVRDRRGEEVVYAAVTLRRAATETDILAFCRSQLAEYKVPRRVDIRDELPRTASGKIRLRPEDVQL